MCDVWCGVVCREEVCEETYVVWCVLCKEEEVSVCWLLWWMYFENKNETSYFECVLA